MTLTNRKAEAEVKSMQSALDALQRSKKEVESATTRKEKEIQALTDKLNCEQTNLSKSNKQVKECGVRMHSIFAKSGAREHLKIWGCTHLCKVFRRYYRLEVLHPMIENLYYM